MFGSELPVALAVELKLKLELNQGVLKNPQVPLVVHPSWLQASNDLIFLTGHKVKIGMYAEKIFSLL